MIFKMLNHQIDLLQETNCRFFGKTADEASLKNALSIGAAATDGNDRPLDEVKITSTRVIETPK